MDAPARDRQDLGLTALGAVGFVVLAWVLRAPGLAHAYSSDEVGLFIPGSFSQQFLDPETGVNPPVFRWLQLLFMDWPDPLYGGRLVALAASVLAVSVGVVGGRLAGGRWWTGWLAGLLMACHPPSIWAATTARAYGPWQLVASAWLVALLAWSQAPDDRRRQAGVALTALALPWVHYVSVPWMLLVGLGVSATSRSLRRAVWLHVPAALGFLPLLWRIGVTTSRREEPIRAAGEVVDLITGLGLWSRALPTLFDGRPSLPSNPGWVAVLVIGLLAAVAVSWKQAPAPIRVAWWAAAAVPLTVAFLATGQAVRPPMATVMVAAAAPLLAGLPGRLPDRWQRLSLAVLTTAWLAWPTSLVWEADASEVRVRNAVREVARWLAEDRWPSDDTLLTPRQHALPLYYYLSGRYISAAPKQGPCGTDDDCVVMRGRAWHTRDDLETGVAPWVLVFARQEPTVDGCTPIDAPDAAWLFRCDASTSP